MRSIARLFRSHSRSVLLVGISTLLGSGSAFASIAGFGGTGTGFTLNGGPNVSGDVLHLTDGGGSEGRSIFYNTPQAYQTGFTAQFTYESIAGGGFADGLAFVLQNDSRGATALGDTGGALGYGGGAFIKPSAALELNLYTGAGPRGSSFRTNGGTGGYSALGGITFGSTPINVTFSYDPSTYLITQSYVQGATSFSKSSPFIFSGAFGGASAAYVGFTGGTGGETATQNVSNFSYTTQSLTASPIVLRDTFNAPNGTALNTHTPEIGNLWSVPVDGGGLFINNNVVDTTGAARVASTNFTSALAAGQSLLLTLHEENVGNFFGGGNISGFDLLAGGSTKLFFGKVSSADSWSIALDNTGTGRLGSSNLTQAADIAFQYSFDTGAVSLWVNDLQIITGFETPGLAINAFGFENNNGGDLKFGNVQAAIIPAPEPASVLLIGLGGIAFVRRRRS